MSKVWFLGLGVETPADVLGTRLEGESVWTLNDWYFVYPWLRYPERVYNIHEVPNEHPAETGRFKDWREWYDRSNASIVTLDDHGLKNQRILDIQSLIAEFGAFFFGSSLGFMFADALHGDVSIIELEGFPLRGDGEYAWQMPSVLHNIDVARSAGITVRTSHENRWRATVNTVSYMAMTKAHEHGGDDYFYGRKNYRKPSWA